MNSNLTTQASSLRSSVVPRNGRLWASHYEHTKEPKVTSELYNFQSRKMAIVNLEAALSNWKQLETKCVSQMSLCYRTRFSSTIRLTPSRTGGTPSNLMRHWLNPSS